MEMALPIRDFLKLKAAISVQLFIDEPETIFQG